MRITERRLRRLIRSVILENVDTAVEIENNMFQYDEDDYGVMNDLASNLSDIFFSLSEHKYDLSSPDEIIATIVKYHNYMTAVEPIDVKTWIEKTDGDGWGGSSLDVSFDFFNKLGYNDNIIERACEYGDNQYWVRCEGRLVSLGDPGNI